MRSWVEDRRIGEGTSPLSDVWRGRVPASSSAGAALRELRLGGVVKIVDSYDRSIFFARKASGGRDARALLAVPILTATH